MYPNPSNGTAYIEFVDAPDQARITVRDVLGRTVMQKEVWGDKVVEFDLNKYRTQQVLFVTVQIDGQEPNTLKLMLVE